MSGDLVELGADVAHQLSRVLRLSRGDRVRAFDDRGVEVELELTTLRAGQAAGRVLRRWEPRSEPSLAVTLLQGIPRRDRLEMAIQKATEVGVSSILPVVCARSVAVVEDGGRGSRMARWRRIAVEATEQSGRTRAPEVAAPCTLGEALARDSEVPLVLAWEAELALPVREGLRLALAREAGAIRLMVGPEGGFEEREVGLARERGAVVVSMGPRILRTETAGPTLAALALYEAGEMGPRRAE
ncbi:MAG: RsmE family RNA methyltransferase [Chloroflexota bacterium]